MKTSSLEILEKTQLPSAQARAILEIMESEFAEHQRSLATQADLASTKSDILFRFDHLTDKFDGLTGKFDDLTDKFDGLTGKFDDLTRKLDDLGRRFDVFGGRLEATVLTLAYRMELESKGIRADLATGLAGLEVKIAGAEARLTRWVFTCILGQSAIFASALYFAFTHAH